MSAFLGKAKSTILRCYTYNIRVKLGDRSIKESAQFWEPYTKIFFPEKEKVFFNYHSMLKTNNIVAAQQCDT